MAIPANDTLADEMAEAVRQSDYGGKTAILIRTLSDGSRHVVMSWEFYQSQLEIAGRKALRKARDNG